MKIKVELCLLIALWIACGVLTAGIVCAHFQREWQDSTDYRTDLGGGILLGLFGPFGLLAVFFLTGFAEHGWTLRKIK